MKGAAKMEQGIANIGDQTQLNKMRRFENLVMRVFGDHNDSRITNDESNEKTTCQKVYCLKNLMKNLLGLQVDKVNLLTDEYCGFVIMEDRGRFEGFIKVRSFLHLVRDEHFRARGIKQNLSV